MQLILDKEEKTFRQSIKSVINKRILIIDNYILYHCGASFKDLGKKCFGINKIEDSEYIEKLVKIEY